MAPVLLPGARHGARLWQVTGTGGTESRGSTESGEGGSQYVPYFYNPHLDPSGRRLLFIWNRGGVEQAWVLDREQAEAVQVTNASGRDQHWSPYIRQGVAGIRPQFVAWSQPDWEHVLFWEDNRLCRTSLWTVEEEELYVLGAERVPQVPHCSAGGWVAWGYLPASLQARLRSGPSLQQLLETDASFRVALQRGGCGFMIFDLVARRLVMDVATPFWPNHVQVSPDHRWVLFCQEGPWHEQRMHLLDVARGTWAPLRPQEDGAAIGHEFWVSPTRVGYHGTIAEPADGRSHNGRQAAQRLGFFGEIDVVSGQRWEIPVDGAERHYGHYHASPDAAAIVTDGEVTADWISVAPLRADASGWMPSERASAPANPGQAAGRVQRLEFRPIGRHDWVRSGDQRVHPHPHWHAGGRLITFTACVRRPDGGVSTHVRLLELPGDHGNRSDRARLEGQGSAREGRGKRTAGPLAPQ